MPSNDTTGRDFPQIIPIPSKRIKDLTGKVFGRLTVLGFAGLTKDKKAKWVCRCECGNQYVARAASLTKGTTSSCGCWKKECAIITNTTHGLHRSPEYFAWQGIKTRCENQSQPGYARYGERGISICERWHNSFENFYADMGPRPGPEYSIDRIDNDGNYEPGNCRWATRSQQGSNRITCLFLEFEGERLTIAEWARKLHISPDVLGQRIKARWSTERALMTPVRTWIRKKVRRKSPG